VLFDFSTRITLPFHSVSSRALIAASASSSLSRDKNPNPRESPDLKYRKEKQKNQLTEEYKGKNNLSILEVKPHPLQVS
jgi:hypothetical protein